MDNQNLSRTARREQNDSNQTPSQGPKKPKPPHKRKKIWRWLLLIILIMTVVGGIVFAKALNNIHKSVDSMQRSADITKARDVKQVIKDGKPFSVLVLGTDTGALQRDRTGLTDSMMLVTINPKTKTTTMMSIPRDIMMAISGSISSIIQNTLNQSFHIRFLNIQ